MVLQRYYYLKKQFGCTSTRIGIPSARGADSLGYASMLTVRNVHQRKPFN